MIGSRDFWGIFLDHIGNWSLEVFVSLSYPVVHLLYYLLPKGKVSATG